MCTIVELRRLPPEPLQFQARCVMAPAAPYRPAPKPDHESSQDVEEQRQQPEAGLGVLYYLVLE